MDAAQQLRVDGATQAKPSEPENPINEKDTQEFVKTDEPNANGKQEKAGTDAQDSKEDADKKGDDKQPSGGFSSTPIPHRPRGYTVKFTFHRASNLPIADINSLSSDPYILAQLNTDTPTRHKEDPPLRFRTHTVRKDKEPVWNEEWIVANVPSSGFKLKLRIYDEDPADKDDKLGRVHITVPSLDENWPGIQNETYKIRTRGSSVRAYTIQALTCCFRPEHHFRGEVYVSIAVLGRTAEDGQHGRLYTVGPCRWIRHHSPILGRLVNIKDPDDPVPNSASGSSDPPKKPVQHYNFQANQMQLQGPVPAELYHRFVEFKPWVGRMFTSSGISGAILGSALRHQHARVYNFGRSTIWGSVPEGPCEELTKQFLDLVHYDQGGRIFTYILTLDALWRFTETGKEFGVDMLSKHTMHSNVSIYIAFSGEFFIRRLKHPKSPHPPHATEETSHDHPPQHDSNETHPPADLDGGPPHDEPPKDPRYYQLVIDNDSGTYRPNAKLLPLLKEFLSRALPGLHVMTLDCVADEQKQQRMKAEQRERKKREGQQIVYTQRGGSRRSSLSSSDEDELDSIQAGMDDEEDPRGTHEHGVVSQVAKDAKLQQKAKVDRFKREYGFNRSDTDEAELDGGQAAGGAEGGGSAGRA